MCSRHQPDWQSLFSLQGSRKHPCPGSHSTNGTSGPLSKDQMSTTSTDGMSAPVGNSGSTELSPLPTSTTSWAGSAVSVEIVSPPELQAATISKDSSTVMLLRMEGLHRRTCCRQMVTESGGSCQYTRAVYCTVSTGPGRRSAYYLLRSATTFSCTAAGVGSYFRNSMEKVARPLVMVRSEVA